jgi:hypothetical protein
MSVPTAEEILNKHLVPANAMIEFARLHTEAALKEASEKATVTPIDHEEISEGYFRPIWCVDDDSILNSYPRDKIK